MIDPDDARFRAARNAAMMGEFPTPEPRTIDYTKRGWGHDYTFDPIDHGLRGDLVGWCTPLPEVGDYLLLKNKGGSTRYRVESVRGYGTPPDMYRATVVFDPRR